MAADVLADLTLRLQASTAEFNQKLKEAGGTVNKFGTKSKKDLKAAQQKTSESLSKMKQGFSGLTSGLTEKLNGITGGLGDMVGSFSGVVSGLRGATAGMKVFKVAMASTGIGLLVVALGSLVAYFTKTQRGADIVSQATAAVGAVFTVLTDTLSGLGEALVGVWNDPMAAIKDFGGMIKDFVLSRFELLMDGVKGIGTAFKLLFEGEFKAAAKEAGKSLLSITRATNPVAWGLEAIGGAVDAIKKKYGEASEKAKEAMSLEAASQKLEKDRVAWMSKAAQIELDMSELIRKSKEKENYTEAQRVEFIKQAQKLQAQLSTQKISYAEEELRIKEGLDSLGENMLADDKATAELRVQILKLKKEENDKTRELVNRENEALNALRGKTKEQEKLNAAKKAEIEQTARITAQIVGTEVSGKGAMDMPAVEMKIAVKKVEPSQLDAAKQAIVDNFRAAQEEMRAIAQEVSGMIQQSLGSAISGFADALGKGIAGDMGGIKNLFNSILGIVIDFGKQFGEMMIGIGLAKISLESLGISGIGAVIAGTALVALTSAASAFLSKGPNIPAFANGGIAPGGMALVGERGPELVSLNKGNRVHSNQQTQKMLGGAQNITVKIESVTRGEDLHHIVKEVERRNSINY